MLVPGEVSKTVFMIMTNALFKAQRTKQKFELNVEHVEKTRIQVIVQGKI